MIKPIFNSQTIFLGLLIINMLLFFVVKGNKKFYYGQFILFVITLITFLIFRLTIFPQTTKSIELERVKSEKTNNGNISSEVYTFTRNKEKTLYSFNRPTLEFCGFQTIFTFLFLLFGLRKTTGTKFFRRASIVFGFLTIVFICIYILVAIIPYGMVM